MATNPSAMVDAIMADLQANAGLPSGQPKSTRSYAEPVVQSGDGLPALAVWCEDTLFRIESTGGNGLEAVYSRDHQVNIAWYVLNPKGAESGGAGDPKVVQALEATMEILIAQVQTYATGLPGLGHMVVGTLVSRHLKPMQGNVFQGLLVVEVREDA